jgi:hypothetical protein
MSCIVNELGNIGFPLSSILIDIRHGVVISNRVADTNDKAIMEKPKLTDNHVISVVQIRSSVISVAQIRSFMRS